MGKKLKTKREETGEKTIKIYKIIIERIYSYWWWYTKSTKSSTVVLKHKHIYQLPNEHITHGDGLIYSYWCVYIYIWKV